MTHATTLFRTAPELQFTTDEPGEAQAFMRRAYTERSMRIAGSPESFRMTHSHVDAGSFSLATLTHTMAVEHAADPLGVLLVGRVAGGRFHRSTCGEELLAGRGDTFLVAPPDRPYVCGWDSVRLQLLTLDPAVLDDVAAHDTQQGRSAHVHFTACTPVSRTTARLCADVIDYLTDHVLGNPAAGDHPLVVDGAARMFAAALLQTFPHEIPGPRPLPAPGSTPAVLRRAVTYIDDHAHERIGLTQIAEAARITPRGLQATFRRYLDTTPTAYLRRTRLDRAHRDLLSAEPTDGDTVTEVALRWGFARRDRFAHVYRQAYHHSPDADVRPGGLLFR